MKTISYFTLGLVLGSFLLLGQVKAQNVGVAADKQKQENLEKNKKRQAELKKKYNSLTPQQAEEARKKADAYKRSGGKSTGTNTKPAPTQKPASAPAVNKGSQAPKQGNVQKPGTGKQPVWMDAKGKPKPSTSAPAGKPEVKPGTSTQKTTVVKPATSEKKESGTKK